MYDIARQESVRHRVFPDLRLQKSDQRKRPWSSSSPSPGKTQHRANAKLSYSPEEAFLGCLGTLEVKQTPAWACSARGNEGRSESRAIATEVSRSPATSAQACGGRVSCSSLDQVKMQEQQVSVTVVRIAAGPADRRVSSMARVRYLDRRPMRTNQGVRRNGVHRKERVRGACQRSCSARPIVWSLVSVQ